MRYLAILLTLSTLWANNDFLREKIRIRQDFEVSNTLPNTQSKMSGEWAI